jgi:hypothetical protein
VKTPKVRLYIRVRESAGRYAYLDPVWNGNSTLRAGYALVAGQPKHHPEGVYYLRFLQGDKRVWQSVPAWRVLRSLESGCRIHPACPGSPMSPSRPRAPDQWHP